MSDRDFLRAFKRLRVKGMFVMYVSVLFITFVSNPCLSYVGGEVLQWDFDPDFLYYYTLCEMVVEAGYKVVGNFVYCGESNVGPDFSGSSDACADNGESTESSGASDTDNSLGSERALGAESEDEDKEVRNINAWDHFLSKIRLIPKLKLTEIQKLAKEELKVELGRDICSRARKLALEEINGRICYEKVFEGEIQGETSVCCGERWFLNNLISNLDIGDGSGFTFMTDKQKSKPPAALVPPVAAAPIPSTPSNPAPPATFQITAFEASILSPSAPSAQPTPPTIPTFSTQQILTTLHSRGKQAM
ncbi:hypothetical protein PVK06_008172 [Gossypium arboreum]|uniref:Uncharacterized protein n=1 Tax=Gossypium arboreum TaxID=29729 RepID=A0ABR0QKL8_GOSAR|nr:hypothetical protein PVK06_008172 [Gossypium arboreum]